MLPQAMAGLLGCAAMTIAGCNCDTGRENGGADAGTQDADAPDAGPPDAGPPDAGPPDAGPGDGGYPPCVMDCTGVVAPTTTLSTTGLVLWLRADVGVRASQETQRVCGWCDLSSAANHLSPRDAGQQTLWVAASTGGHPAVAWTDTEVLERSGVLGIGATSGRTLVMVVRLDDAAVRSAPFYQGLLGSLSLWWGLDPNTFHTVGNRFGVYLSSNAFDTTRATDLAPHVHVTTIDSFMPGGVVGSVMHYHLDGALQTLTATSGSSATNLVQDFSSANATMLGFGIPERMTISEVLVYDRSLPDADRQAIEQALRTRYGL